MFKIVAISDTHNQHDKIVIPECDFLIHCGDYSSKGYEREVRKFYKWMNEQPARYKISVQGNHELGWETNPAEMTRIAKEECPNIHLLYDQELVIEGIKFWGTPVTPYFFNWAYNRARTTAEMIQYGKPLIKEHYDLIPSDVDVLITHGPPHRILDELTFPNGQPKGQFVGCVDLLETVRRVKPDLHFFGHIHGAHGEAHIDGTSFYNVSVCNEYYSPSNKVTVVEYTKE